VALQKGTFNEYRNDFDYSSGPVFIWRRRLVLQSALANRPTDHLSEAPKGPKTDIKIVGVVVEKA
jgi:hypothetical protein